MVEDRDIERDLDQARRPAPDVLAYCQPDAYQAEYQPWYNAWQGYRE
jgi:hypothetical protein